MEGGSRKTEGSISEESRTPLDQDEGGSSIMTMIWPVLTALLLGLLILHSLKMLWVSRRYPPGPLPLPIIGSIYAFQNGIFGDILSKVEKLYGNIFTIWFGNKPMILVRRFQTMKEVLINHSEHFNERPMFEAVKPLTDGKGMVFAHGHNAKQKRRFAQVTMRKLGLGKKSIEHQIEEEAHQLVESIVRLEGQPFDPSLPITNSVANMICALAFGHRFSTEDKDFQNLIEAVHVADKFLGSLSNGLYDLLPWLMKHLPGPHQAAFSSMDRIRSFIKKQIETHKEHQAPHEPRDFIDFYFLQMGKSKDDPSSTYNEENLLSCILEIFVAGTETTTAALQWALLLMAGHPDIQEKVQKEIDDVWDPSQPIRYQDLKKLPYTNAVLHEILRANFVLLHGIPRQCSEDVNILGFHFHKGDYVYPDVRSVLNDPKVWETPQEFNPGHFLDENQCFRVREEFLAFGAGSRKCLGEQLARIEIFILLSHLLKALTLKLPEGVKGISEKYIKGISTPPQPYKLCAVPRYGASS